MSKNKNFPPEYSDIYQLISELIKQELKEYNAMSTGAVSGYTGPLGMNTKPGHKLLWSNPPRDNGVRKEQLEIEYPYGDPDVIQGMMGTDSGPIIQPRHLAGAVDTGDTKRRGTTVGDKLKERNNVLDKENVEENVLDQQGHKYVGKNYRLGSETYLQKDEPQKKRETAIIKAVNKNIDKGKWGKKNTFKDPPSMGISLEGKKT